MKNKCLYVYLLLVMTSCSHYYYLPSTQYVPLFREKNEYRATVSLGQGEEISTIDLQAAFSITDKYAIMTNLMFTHGNDKNSDSWGKGQYFDAAFGYFKPFSKHWVLEIYGGLGVSSQHHRYSVGSSDLSFTKVFIQPSVGLTFNAFDVALTSSFSNINFYKIYNKLNSISSDYSSVERIARKNNSILFEPSLTIRGGWKYLKLQLQLGLSENLSHTNLDFETYKLNLGLTFAFAQRFGKKNIGALYIQQ